VYYYQIKDLISAVPDPGQLTNSYQNSSNQNGYGSEFEFNWQWSKQWNVKGNYAWQHSINEKTNQPVTGVPVHHVYVAFQWQFMQNWQFQPQLNWIGGRTSVPSDTRNLGDYETIDFTLRGKKLFGHLNLAASLRNAFDTNYYEPATLQLPQNLPMPGRSFYLEGSINF
jgi:iron complex outermembrane receptor protein